MKEPVISLQGNVYTGAHNPKGRRGTLVIPPVVEWYLQENFIIWNASSYAWLVYYTTSAKWNCSAYVERTI